MERVTAGHPDRNCGSAWINTLTLPSPFEYRVDALNLSPVAPLGCILMSPSHRNQSILKPLAWFSSSPSMPGLGCLMCRATAWSYPERICCLCTRSVSSSRSQTLPVSSDNFLLQFPSKARHPYSLITLSWQSFSLINGETEIGTIH